MIVASLSQAASVVQGNLIGPDATFRGVSTDTRSLREDELFVALKGPNFDGAAFVRDAAEKGAAGAIVSEAVDSTLAQIEVDDPLMALGDLAADWRRQLSVRVAGLTGSNGKTTVKEMLSACLAEDDTTFATVGNFNNEIGVPLMLLRLSPEHRYAVIEMGANHAGEIAYLTDRVAPDVVTLTNAGPAHLEGFGSIEGVSRAKGEILQGSPRPAFAVLNADDQYFSYWSGLVEDIRVISFGRADSADVRVSRATQLESGLDVELSIYGEAHRIGLAFEGQHNALNAAAAAAAATAMGVTTDKIVAGLSNARPAAGRLRIVAGISGARLIDDSYNANPSSVMAAARLLGEQDGNGWLILGDMAELGPEADRFHREVGEQARAAGVGRLYCTGPHSRNAKDGFGNGGQWFESVDALIDAVIGELQAAGPVNILVKGSRSMHMERAVQALTDPAVLAEED